MKMRGHDHFFTTLPLIGIAVLLIMLLESCTTTYFEYEGQCLDQTWSLSSFVLRKRQICDLPVPGKGEDRVIDQDAINPNPFPGLWEENPADTIDSNLLEKRTLIKKMNGTKDQDVIEELMRQYKALEEE